MFTEQLFPLVVDESKTQTRRRIKGLVPHKISEDEKTNFDHWNVKPRYKKGETIYLKEPYYIIHPVLDDKKDIVSMGIFYQYKPEGEQTIYPEGLQFKKEMVGGLKSKMFMPEKFARHHIKIKKVWAENLKDISEEDATQEGVAWVNEVRKKKRLYMDYMTGKYSFSSAKESYLSLWGKVNGDEWLIANPCVWCYEFKLAK